ncbi:DUF2637 domain-containing protein [Streptomyces sp. 4N124]|uniref:DUF2637 domain-containing protein n=1 Tax=Streptomyces sp. 4N124 TaxID=3457420 RepID=UPI003FD66F40
MQGSAEGRGFNLDAWIRPLCALVVAGVAAYASYVHQREFALQGRADEVSASLWPLSVDGLLLLATVGLLKPSGGRHAPSARCRVVGISAGDRGLSGCEHRGGPRPGVEAGACRGVASGRFAAVGGASGVPAG